MGANIGDAEGALSLACEALAALPDVRLDAVSTIYRTEPQDLKEQPWFHNQVARMLCGSQWEPLEFLKALLSIEQRLGRVRTGPRYGPRHMDLDLLLFGEHILESEVLTLPHPKIRERAFVLVPLREIAPDLVFPDGEPLSLAIEKLRFDVTSNEIRQ